jgi:acyl-CoA reductase-like NAD-dependent aldehyde dehydrogenase
MTTPERATARQVEEAIRAYRQARTEWYELPVVEGNSEEVQQFHAAMEDAFMDVLRAVLAERATARQAIERAIQGIEAILIDAMNGEIHGEERDGAWNCWLQHKKILADLPRESPQERDETTDQGVRRRS